ncbi:MAG: SEC-C metal-binding domain-containing protein, partial [Nitrospinaceae bacterium]
HEEVFGAASGKYDLKEKEVGPDLLRYPERMIMLQVLDNLWRDHLLAMDHLKEGIGLRGYAQKNPLNEYKKEGFDLFRQMNFRMKEEICEFLFKAQINREAVQSLESHQDKEVRKVMEHRGEGPESQKPAPVKRDENKVGRNDPCPCGSGKKYKKCHGK